MKLVKPLNNLLKEEDSLIEAVAISGIKGTLIKDLLNTAIKKNKVLTQLELCTQQYNKL